MNNNFNKLYNLVENLKDKISKLDNKNKIHYVKKNNIHSNNSSLLTYRISFPYNYENNNKQKKFIGLLFNNIINDASEIDNSNIQLSFISLKKSNCIINCSIQLEISNNQFNINTLSAFSISVGVREKGSSKIKIIKGSKNIFDIQPNKSLYIINSTVLYGAESGDEICLITDINNIIKINSNKSIIKILTL